MALFNYLDYKNRIPLEKCIIQIPRLSPLSMNYEKFWIHTMKKKQIEGHWVDHNGDYQWLPGPIFQYVNLWTIEMKKKGGSSKGKVLGKPRLRDLEWIKGYVHATARGFSGFKDDDKYNCHRLLNESALEIASTIDYLEPHIKNSIYNSDGKWKEYKPALEYLYEYKTRNLGRPLYYNTAKNVVDIESRNVGKTMICNNFTGHNFLTDGVMDFDEWWENRNKPKELQDIYTTQTLIGATSASVVANFNKHLRIGLENLPGRMEISGLLYPAPLSKQFSGSWVAGKDIIANYQEKVGNLWITKGTGSGFLNRTFKDNEFAANGTRYGYGNIDEIGLMSNVVETLGQLHQCTLVDGEKYGSIWMAGTGGKMDGGASESVKKVFYAPASYDCLEFDDIFEGSGKKIGFFVPITMSFDEFRDELGNINMELSLRKVMKERAIKIKGSKKGYNDLLQSDPLVPSEAFLTSGGNIFNRPELKEHIKFLENSTDGFIKGRWGELIQTSDRKVIFKEDFTHKLHPCTYPLEEKDDKTGCIVIWEEPIDSPPYTYYISTLDPYAKDEALNSVSLGSFGVFARAMVNGSWYDKLVAEYTGRPDTMDEFMDNCRKLVLYYNASNLYENNFGELWKAYMQNRNLLHMLFKTPTVLKNNKADAVANTYGLRMTNAGGHGLKEELENYTRDWLYTEIGDGKLNLHNINSVPLLKELEAYNEHGNFDRVIMLMLFVAQKIQLHKIVLKSKEESKKKWMFNHVMNGVI